MVSWVAEASAVDSIGVGISHATFEDSWRLSMGLQLFFPVLILVTSPFVPVSALPSSVHSPGPHGHAEILAGKPAMAHEEW